MKKSFILILIIVLSIISITGCNKKLGNNENIYKLISLKDGNVKVFNGVIPKNWNSSIESNWNVVNSAHPGKEIVTLSSPDGKASIKIISQQSYVQNNKYNEGENTEYYTTYLHYMNASNYLDYYMNNNYTGSKFVKNMKVEDKTLSEAQAYNNLVVANSQEYVNTINNQGKVHVSASLYDTTVSKKQYECGTNYIEAFTAVAANQTTLQSNLSPLLNSESITWIIPYTIVFVGEDKEAFDKYYKDYEFIIGNSYFTTDYYAMIEYVSSAIVNSYTSYYAAKSKAALAATNSYIDSNYSSTSSASTNEKVMEMWDDCINEVDKYKTLDGGSIKTSIHNDVVAQNGNEIYVGSKAGIPSGFTQLDKAY